MTREKQATEEAVPSDADEPLLSVGRFRATSVLGEGGQGIVYRGEHVELGYPVAIKVLHDESASELTRARFRREARLGAQVQHPNVVRVIELGELDDGSPFIVMEFIDGVSLSELIATRTLSPDATVELGLQLLAALAALHARGVVHRDIKPENVMLERSVDGTINAKILDFGISKTDDKELEPATLTRAGTIVGTPSYMSPEHVRGEPLDVRSDLYAVAGVLYEAIGGHPPHEAPTMSAVFAKIATEPVPPLRTHAPSCPAVLADVIDRGLRREREERFAHPLEMAEALRAAAHELSLARGADAWADVLGESCLRETQPLELVHPRRSSSDETATVTAPAARKDIRPSRRWRTPAAVGLAMAVGGFFLQLVTTEGTSETSELSPVVAPPPPMEAPVESNADEGEETSHASEREPPSLQTPDELPLTLETLEHDARIAFVRGDGERSAALYQKVLERDPTRASAWRGFGLVSLAYGEHREARRALERYLELAPDAHDRARIEKELRALR